MIEAYNYYTPQFKTLTLEEISQRRLEKAEKAVSELKRKAKKVKLSENEVLEIIFFEDRRLNGKHRENVHKIERKMIDLEFDIIKLKRQHESLLNKAVITLLVVAIIVAIMGILASI